AATVPFAAVWPGSALALARWRVAIAAALSVRPPQVELRPRLLVGRVDADDRGAALDLLQHECLDLVLLARRPRHLRRYRAWQHDHAVIVAGQHIPRHHQHPAAGDR